MSAFDLSLTLEEMVNQKYITRSLDFGVAKPAERAKCLFIFALVLTGFEEEPTEKGNVSTRPM